MANPKSRIYNQFPYDSNMGDQSKQCLDWVVTQINQLLGQGGVPPAQSLASFGPNIVDPTSAQITSKGSRTSSITTSLAFVAQPTTINFYWDGTNGSKPFQIYRDDGSVFGPFITGSPFTVSGLVANTQYFFYPYWDETQQVIGWANIPGTSVGTPSVAFAAGNILAAQQQILRGRLALGVLLASTGVTTPNVGSTPGTGGNGGGGGGGITGGNYKNI